MSLFDKRGRVRRLMDGLELAELDEFLERVEELEEEPIPLFPACSFPKIEAVRTGRGRNGEPKKAVVALLPWEACRKIDGEEGRVQIGVRGRPASSPQGLAA